MLAVAIHGHFDWLAHRGGNHQPDVAPGGILPVSYASDSVTERKSCRGGGGIRLQPSDDGGTFLISRFLIAVHIQARQQDDGKHDVHRGSHHGDDKALPARLGLKLVGVAGGGFVGIFAGHLDVAAERQQAHPVIGFALFETPQALAESERKHFHADAKIFCRQKVAQLVDEDHHPQNDHHGKQVGYDYVEHSSIYS